jgi:uncharacterized MAPEG superfamily protein
MPVELILLGCSVVLLFVHIAIQGTIVTRERGTVWNTGPRDAATAPLGKAAGRAQRALDNYKETYPAFIALALGLVATHHTGGPGAIGAGLWFAARIVYIPLYLSGVAYVRTACWMVSVLGLLLMLVRMF